MQKKRARNNVVRAGTEACSKRTLMLSDEVWNSLLHKGEQANLSPEEVIASWVRGPEEPLAHDSCVSTVLPPDRPYDSARAAGNSAGIDLEDWQQIAKHLGNGLMVFDAQQLLLINPKALQLHGYPTQTEAPATVKGFVDDFECFSWDNCLLSPAQQPIERILQGETLVDCMVMLKHRKTGSTWWSSQTGAALRDDAGLIRLAFVFIRDITELKAELDFLRQSHEHLLMAEQFADISTWSWDLRTKQVSGTSTYYKTILGIPPEMEIDSNDVFMTFVHPEDRPMLERLEENNFAPFGDSMQIEFRIVRPDGTVRWLLERAKIHRDGSGQALYLTGADMDITERKQLEQERLDLEKVRQQEVQRTELQRLDRLKDHFLSTVSHELRTPLSNMRLAIHMLEDLPLNEPHQHYRRILREECGREITLVNNLLDLQRLEQGGLLSAAMEIEAASWAEALIETFRERLGAQGQRLNLRIIPYGLRLYADRTCLDRILLELLSNACKYSPPESEIFLAIESTPDHGVLLSVHNEGDQIPPEELAYVFEKFFRASNSGTCREGGTGLGLALVRQLVNVLGGTVRAVSEPGRSVFTVWLPHRVLHRQTDRANLTPRGNVET